MKQPLAIGAGSLLNRLRELSLSVLGLFDDFIQHWLQAFWQSPHLGVIPHDLIAGVVPILAADNETDDVVIVSFDTIWPDAQK